MAAIKVYQPVVVNDVTSLILPLDLIKRINSLTVGRVSQLENRTTTTTGTGGIYGEFQEDTISEITKQMWYNPVAVVVRSLKPDGVYILRNDEGIFALPVVSSTNLSEVTNKNGIYMSKFAEALSAAFQGIISSLDSNLSQGTFQFYFSLGHEKVKEGQLPTVFLSAPAQWRVNLFPHPILLVLKARCEKEIKFNATVFERNISQVVNWELQNEEENQDLLDDDQRLPLELAYSDEEQILFTNVIDKHPGTKAIKKAFLNAKNKEQKEVELNARKIRNQRGGRDKLRQRSVQRPLPNIIHFAHNTNTYDNIVGGAGLVSRGDLVTPSIIPNNEEEARGAAGEGKKEEAEYLKLVDNILSGKVTGVSYSYPDWVISAICTTLNVPFSLVTKDRDQIEEYSTQAGQNTLFFFSKTQDEAKKALEKRILEGVKKPVAATAADNNNNNLSVASNSKLPTWNDLVYNSQFFAITPRGKEMLEEMHTSRVRNLDTSFNSSPTQSWIPRTTNREDVIYRLLGGIPPLNKKLPYKERMNEETTREWTRLVVNSFDGKLPSPNKTFRPACSKKGKTMEILAMNTQEPPFTFYIRTSKTLLNDDENNYNFPDTDGWGLTVERVVGSRLNSLRSDYFAKTFFVNEVGLASEYVIYDFNQVLDCETGKFAISDLPPQELSLGEYVSLETTKEKDSGACVVQGLLALYEANVKLGFVHGNATCDRCCSVRYNQGLEHPSFSINEEEGGEWVANFKFVPTTIPVFIPEEMGKSRIITERGGWFPHSTILETNLIDEKLIPRPQGAQRLGHTARIKSYAPSFELDVFTLISTSLIRRLKRRRKIIDSLLDKTQPKRRRYLNARKRIDVNHSLREAKLAPDTVDDGVYLGIIKTIASLKSFASKRVPADHPTFVFLSNQMDSVFVDTFRKNKHVVIPEPLDTKANTATFIDVLNCVISTFGLDGNIVLSQTHGHRPRPKSEAFVRTLNNNMSITNLANRMGEAVKDFLIINKNPFEYLREFYDVQMWFAENKDTIPTDHAILPPAKSAQHELYKIRSERRKMFRDIIQYLSSNKTEATLNNIEDVLLNPSITSLPKYVMTETGRYIRERNRLMDRDNFLPIDLCVEIAQHSELKRTRQNLTRIYEAVGPLNST